MTVSGAPGTLTDVDVLLNGYSDPAPASVDLLLVGPTSKQAVIMSDVGGVLPIVDADLVVDDEAAVAMPATAMTSGSFTGRPTSTSIPARMSSRPPHRTPQPPARACPSSTAPTRTASGSSMRSTG